MKVSIGSKIVEGPYGGGNLFVKNLALYLNRTGNSVVYDLKDKDIDIVLIINPLKHSESATFDHLDALYYSKFINPNAIIIQRVNECDERKNTNNVNSQIIYANQFVDFTVYVSKWMSDLFQEKGLNIEYSKVILSGSDINIFNQNQKEYWNNKSIFKVVSHHWSQNWMKGFDTYKFIDDLLEKPEWSNRISFTYIGNLPKNFLFKNTEVLKPLSGSDLANKLKSFHGYVTGSVNEPSGNHHIEAMQCGLPVFYINSGGIPEYCKENGLVFENENLESQLDIFINNYQEYVNSLKTYTNNSDRMSKEFLDLFMYLIDNKQNIISRRSNINSIKVYYLNRKSKMSQYIYKLVSIFKNELSSFKKRIS